MASTVDCEVTATKKNLVPAMPDASIEDKMSDGDFREGERTVLGAESKVSEEKPIDECSEVPHSSHKPFLEPVTYNNMTMLRSSASKGDGFGDTRSTIWPKLLDIDIESISSEVPEEEDEDMENHKFYSVVLLDIHRTLQFPTDMDVELTKHKLLILIMRVLTKHPTLYYYRGFHEICAPFLHILGKDVAFHVVERLCKTHLEAFMQKTMNAPNMLDYIYIIIIEENGKLYDFLEYWKIDITFVLSWIITWFSNVFKNYSDVLRLFDFFIASESLMPVYFSACVLLHRANDIMEHDDNLTSIEEMLMRDMPEDLPMERLITLSSSLYSSYPPDFMKFAVADLAERRRCNRDIRWKLFWFFFKTFKFFIWRSEFVALAAIFIFSRLFKLENIFSRFF